jgi:hypothetical protein
MTNGKWMGAMKAEKEKGMRSAHPFFFLLVE